MDGRIGVIALDFFGILISALLLVPHIAFTMAEAIAEATAEAMFGLSS